ncbi:MAG: hypothetical protein MUF49_25280 [Oculatellaceae cyanobacterium Prado106]|nr:hypothetical protein [Oculatellaceae cyanobacterium Prado106]
MLSKLIGDRTIGDRTNDSRITLSPDSTALLLYCPPAYGNPIRHAPEL